MPNEWNITGQAATWMTEICKARPELGFKKATVEETVLGKATRHDITLFNDDDEAVLCGEAKRPENPDGRNPMGHALLMDAFVKASTSGIRYFFTWNVNRCVLFDSLEDKPLVQRRLEFFHVLDPDIKSSKELDGGKRENEIKKFLEQLLERLSAITKGASTLGTLPLDELFLINWETALQQPVAQTYASLQQKYGEVAFTKDLNAWMRDKQGLTLSDDPQIRAENLERAAKIACYVLANRILFYKALLRNPAFKKLPAFVIPDDVKTGAEFGALISKFWERARKVTRDYETIFGGNEIGDLLPFFSDAAVDAWRDLSEATEDFDFTQLGFEVIGQIFERLLSTEERHKFGQHYTRSEVVDLINAFCIRDADAVTFDPACGGGTFLVRAYARKKHLAAGTLSHQDLLPQLIGNDISAYPAHLTTINLATRDLIDKANYPFVLRGDFFKLSPGEAAFSLPLSGQGSLTDDVQVIPEIDAFVGNPPYIRQEKLGEYYGKGYKEDLLKMANRVAPAAQFANGSDIHCYFFPHAMEFLKADGWIGFLVSSSWLDTVYGFRLQKFLLDNFRIVAFIESAVEPWFTGARVTTVAVILQRESDPQKRAENMVRWVWGKKPLAELIPAQADEAARQTAYETLRDRIESAPSDETFQIPLPGGGECELGQTNLDGWRVRSLKQGDLERLGQTGWVPSPAEEEDEADETPAPKAKSAAKVAKTMGADEYGGSKWGMFLRAPDVFFQLRQLAGNRLTPLGTLAQVKYGVKPGCDDFFCPKDVTDDVTDEVLTLYGMSREQSDHLRLIESGQKTFHVMEAEYLEPEVHSLMGMNKIEIESEDLKRQVVLVSTPKDEIAGKNLLAYIEWGESEKFNERKTCASRPYWHVLPESQGVGLVIPILQQYKHIVFHNPEGYFVRNALMEIKANDEEETQLLGAILNSTVCALSKQFFARQHGREGSLQLDVYAAKIMLVPDPRGASDEVKEKLLAAFEQMKTRVIGPMVIVDGVGAEPSGELAESDRQALDDATLELLGVSDPAQRLSLRKALYGEFQTFIREIRIAELEMQGHRNKATRKGTAGAHTLANEIWESLETPPAWRLPAAFLDEGEKTESFFIEAGKAKVVAPTIFQGAGAQIAGTLHETGDESRAQWLVAHAHAQVWGEIATPIKGVACAVALAKWRSWFEEIDTLFRAEASARTIEEKRQNSIVSELWKKCRNT